MAMRDDQVDRRKAYQTPHFHTVDYGPKDNRNKASDTYKPVDGADPKLDPAG